MLLYPLAARAPLPSSPDQKPKHISAMKIGKQIVATDSSAQNA